MHRAQRGQNGSNTCSLSSVAAFTEALNEVADATAAARLFVLFNRIALLKYEDAENTGRLLLCARSTALISTQIRFEFPIELCDMRGLRKYLQITAPGLPLVTDCRLVYGFASQDYNEGCYFLVQFFPGGLWRLYREGRLLLEVSSVSSTETSRALNKEKFLGALHNTFGSLRPEQTVHLCDLINAAVCQSRGTNVLISAQAAEEALRLHTQCTRIQPIRLTPLLMERFTSIDGTVVIDSDGTCHAIGAILDGDVTTRGDRSRGGRYNSAVMYVDCSVAPSIIVVVSHEGTVDVVSRPAYPNNE